MYRYFLYFIMENDFNYKLRMIHEQRNLLLDIDIPLKLLILLLQYFSGLGL